MNLTEDGTGLLQKLLLITESHYITVHPCIPAANFMTPADH